MKKPLNFYVSLAISSLLLVCSCIIIGFLIYFIVIGATLNALGLAIITPILVGSGIAMLIHTLKMLKTLNNISAIYSLYPDFVQTEYFEIHTQGFKKSTLLLDSINQQFIFILADQVVPSYKFADIIGYDVYENEKNVYSCTRTNPNKNKYFGWVGNAGGNILADTVYSLQVVIKTIDVKNPYIIINYLPVKSIDRLKPDYREYINAINKLCSKLDSILAKPIN